MDTKELLSKITKASSIANQVVNAESWNGYCATGTEGQTWYDTQDIATMMNVLHPLLKQINKTHVYPKLSAQDATRFGATAKSLNEDNSDLADKLTQIRIQLINKVYRDYSAKDVIKKLIKDLKDTQSICNYELKQPPYYDKTFGAKKLKLKKLQQKASQVFLYKPYNDYLYLTNHHVNIPTSKLSYNFSRVNDGYWYVDKDLLVELINGIKKSLKKF